MHQDHSNNAGFTLIELMVTIAVLAIIVGIAAPNISNQLADQRSKSTTATLYNALKEAKSESVIRRQIMKISYDNNGTNAGTIEIDDANGNNVTSYQYDTRSTIKSSDDEVKFNPHKTADEMTFTICDSNLTANTRQIVISKLGNIKSQLGGLCP